MKRTKQLFFLLNKNQNRMIAGLAAITLILTLSACGKKTVIVNSGSSQENGQITSEQGTSSFGSAISGSSSLFSSNGKISSAGASSQSPSVSSANKITVSTKNVISTDFLGLGGNVLPTLMMSESLAAGYNKAYYELDKARMALLRPKVIRVWFQVDWFEETKGSYDFNTSNMKAFADYMRFFKSIGTEVELNYGWKAGSKIWSWYGITGVDKYTSAPADIADYAKGCSALIKNLVQVQGLTNIKYLTFYNEPNGNWDFETAMGTDQSAYYIEMAKAVDSQLKNDGLRKLVEIWGPEESGAPEWLSYMMKGAGNIFDAYTCHEYDSPYDNIARDFGVWKGFVGGKRLGLTEFGWNSADDTSWKSDYTGTVIASANNGLFCDLIWIQNGARLVDPGNYAVNDHALWNFLPNGGTKVNKAYYIYGLLERYIPAHSTVLGTAVPDSNSLRSTAFLSQDGNYTIVLECKGGNPKDYTISFDTKINKTFHKFVYDDYVVPNEVGMLPVETGTFSATDSFTDSIGSDYSTIVYTTAEPAVQVLMTPVFASATAGKATTLYADIAGSTDKRVTWSAVTGSGTLTSAGVYTPSTADKGNVVAIKAASAKNPEAYGICLLKIN